MREVPLERIECINLKKWATYNKLPLIHIPNEGKRSNFSGSQLKQMGMTPGVCDFFLPVPYGLFHGMWIEMKRQKGASSRVSDTQKSFIKLMLASGYAAVVAYGWVHGKDLIEHYLERVPRGTIEDPIGVEDPTPAGV